MAVSYESFSTWFEGKTDLPLFTDLPPSPRPFKQEPKFPSYTFAAVPTSVIPIPAITQVSPAVSAVPVQEASTSSLLREFETVFDSVELKHNTLTPPQSPPAQEVVELQNVGFGFYQARDEFVPATPQPDVAHELAVVEELVRSRAENLVDSWAEPRSPAPPSPSSSSSNCSYSECSSDPEWIPEPVNALSPTGVLRQSKHTVKRSKPYARLAPEDKKSRKKEQNKNAATRYRQKKKQEIEEILSEEKDLMDHNDSLCSKVTDLQREIKYLKGLMRDLFKAKGLIQ